MRFNIPLNVAKTTISCQRNRWEHPKAAYQFWSFNYLYYLNQKYAVLFRHTKTKILSHVLECYVLYNLKDTDTEICKPFNFAHHRLHMHKNPHTKKISFENFMATDLCPRFDIVHISFLCFSKYLSVDLSREMYLQF